MCKQFLHQLAHWFGVNYIFLNVYSENEQIFSCLECNTCGLKTDVRKLMDVKDLENFSLPFNK